MMTSGFLRGFTIVTGLVIAGEALVLAVGMHVLSPNGNPWISLKNDLLLALDVMVGLGLVVFAVANRRTFLPGLLYVSVLISVVAHGYREWEYLIRVSNAFCSNAPLFVVNSPKLVALPSVAVAMLCAPRTSGGG
jgi:hypothetical protein